MKVQVMGSSGIVTDVTVSYDSSKGASWEAHAGGVTAWGSTHYEAVDNFVEAWRRHGQKLTVLYDGVERSRHSQRPAPSLQWEYTSARMEGADEFLADANTLGADGWELVANPMIEHRGAYPPIYTAFFKRRKQTP